MATVRVLGAAVIRELVGPADLVGPMRVALTAVSAGTAWQHPRVSTQPSSGDTLLLMPARAGDAVGVKVLTLFPAARAHGLPTVQGVVLLLDGTTGRPLALLDGAVLTGLRTAAVSAVGIAELARPDAATLAVIGAGVQARSHLAALSGVRDWDRVRLYGPTPDRVDRLAGWARRAGIPIEPVRDVGTAVRGADVVCTVTSACRPVLADADVAAGALVVAVGAYGPRCRELPGTLMGRSTLFADSRDAVDREAGDLLLAREEGALDPRTQVTELGEVLAGRRPGRTTAGGTTVFKSVGLPVEDVVAAALVHQRAMAADAGVEVEL